MQKCKNAATIVGMHFGASWRRWQWIRHNYVPDFDGAHPQGVQWDSLESFVSIGARKVGETPALRAFLRTQRRQLYYMYCRIVLYIIYVVFYNMCERCAGLVVQ